MNWYSAGALLLAYFLALALFSTVKRTTIAGKTIFMFRMFFPSWRFFDDIGHVPVLFYRKSTQGKEFEPWVECLNKPTRKWRTLLLNPQGNFLLACGSLLQRLVH